MSIRIQRCHPQVHLTHIDFTVTHSLKRFPEANTHKHKPIYYLFGTRKTLSFSSVMKVTLPPFDQPCRQHALSSATMHCGG